MKHLKRFEETLVEVSDEVKNKIEYDFIQTFKSEDAYSDFCKEMSGVDDVEYVDWDYIPQDVINHMDLENEYRDILLPTLIDIITDIMTDVDLDKCEDIRENDYKYFLKKKELEKDIFKYNL